MPRIANPKTKEDYVQQKYIFDLNDLHQLNRDLLSLRNTNVEGFHPSDMIRATRRLLGAIVSCDVYCSKGWLIELKCPAYHEDKKKIEEINQYMRKHRSLYMYRDLIRSLSDRISDFKDMTLNQKFDMMGDLIDDLLVLNTKMELIFLSMKVRK